MMVSTISTNIIEYNLNTLLYSKAYTKCRGNTYKMIIVSRLHIRVKRTNHQYDTLPVFNLFSQLRNELGASKIKSYYVVFGYHFLFLKMVKLLYDKIINQNQ